MTTENQTFRNPLRGGIWTVSNPKTTKGEGKGYVTLILHLAPADSAGVVRNGRVVDVCRFRSPGCSAGCLNYSGHGGIYRPGESTNAIQEARKRRTLALFADWKGYLSRAVAELRYLQSLAEAQGFRVCARPNGTSDLPRLAHDLATACPDVQFYDYTKVPNPGRRVLPNYHLTFSASETNAAHVLSAIREGVNVATVFRVKAGHALPGQWLGRPVVDGDASDLRFTDPRSADGRGLIVGLRAKGSRAQRDTSGFVVRL